ncbi:hypothetical protein LSAT2_005610 [Lamellibrachia satsuma]|nr:hypothetical protein LSAT2_005610 [Lamellibrachia satsuma]
MDHPCGHDAVKEVCRHRAQDGDGFDGARSVCGGRRQEPDARRRQSRRFFSSATKTADTRMLLFKLSVLVPGNCGN